LPSSKTFSTDVISLKARDFQPIVEWSILAQQLKHPHYSKCPEQGFCNGLP
jgi:hypothetical protein